MLRSFCDKCDKPSEASGSRRHEALAYATDGTKIGLELAVLFNGQVTTERHICDDCVRQMIAAKFAPPPKATPATPGGVIEKGLRQTISDISLKHQSCIDEIAKLVGELHEAKAVASSLKVQSDRAGYDFASAKKEMNTLFAREVSRVRGEAESRVAAAADAFERRLRTELDNQESRLAREWGAKMNELRKELRRPLS